MFCFLSFLSASSKAVVVQVCRRSARVARTIPVAPCPPLRRGHPLRSPGDGVAKGPSTSMVWPTCLSWRTATDGRSRKARSVRFVGDTSRAAIEVRSSGASPSEREGPFKRLWNLCPLVTAFPSGVVHRVRVASARIRATCSRRVDEKSVRKCRSAVAGTASTQVGQNFLTSPKHFSIVTKRGSSPGQTGGMLHESAPS